MHFRLISPTCNVSCFLIYLLTPNNLHCLVGLAITQFGHLAKPVLFCFENSVIPKNLLGLIFYTLAIFFVDNNELDHKNLIAAAAADTLCRSASAAAVASLCWSVSAESRCCCFASSAAASRFCHDCIADPIFIDVYINSINIIYIYKIY